MRRIAIALAVMLASGAALAADAVKKDGGILDRLYANTGVYNKSAAGKTPSFVSDPGFPAPLPHSWMLGQVAGLYVDQHDHIWVYHRPRALDSTDSGAQGEAGKDAKGNPISAMGHSRRYGQLSGCCIPAPSVLERCRSSRSRMELS